MALTVSHLGSSVHGNHRYIAARLTPSTTGEEVWTTGLNNILGGSICLGSAVSGGVRIELNELSASTASPGSVAIRSHSAGDEIQIMVFGA